MKTFTRSVIEMMIFILAILLLVQLGLWQLKRAEQKMDILQAFKRNQDLNVQKYKNDIQAFTRVKLEGDARLPILYLDNQFYQHQAGYHVLCLIKVSASQHVLADLGWIGAGETRAKRPSVELPLRHIWQGYAYFPEKKTMALGQWLEFAGKKSLVIESLDLDAIKTYLNVELAPWVLRVNQNAIYEADWPLVSVQPDRHRAYALQWFSMAVILCLIFLWRIFK